MTGKRKQQAEQEAQPEQPSITSVSIRWNADTLRQVAGIVAVVFGVALLVWWQWPRLLELLTDEASVRLLIQRLGWLGPVALILFNTLQIVIAPIPGYFVQAAAGYLYGPIWGGVWATCGLITGSMLAMGLTRRFGRPLAVAMIGQERLDQWETTTHSTNPVVWFLLLLAPIGDLPYFLAGLARVSYQRIALLTFVVRAPTVFAWAAIGAGVIGFSWWQWLILFTLLGGMLILFLRYQKQLFGWIERNIHQQVKNDEYRTEMHSEG
ncbi:MAG: VTT domain-containing protein [Caldilineaceae bacterium]